MGALSWAGLLITHPNEFKILLQYYLWHDQRDVSAKEEWPHTGYDRDTMKKCWYFLDQTSRSFSSVIKQLEGDMARVVSTGYSARAGLCVLTRSRSDVPVLSGPTWPRHD